MLASRINLRTEDQETRDSVGKELLDEDIPYTQQTLDLGSSASSLAPSSPAFFT